MAITPTGNIYKALTFDGQSSRTFGVYITGEAVFNAPAREVEMISIPGRNGAFALDKGRFENIEVSYPAGIFADTEADFAAAVSGFRNYLCSRSGYVRLTDEYNPNEYRLAIYKSGLEVDPAQLRAGEFDIVFDCKPQRFLTSGEDPISVESGDTVTNPTLFEASPVLEVEGYGTIGFNDYSVTIENETLGEVLLSGGGSTPLWPDFSPLNNGDSITVKSASGTVGIRLTSGYTLLGVTVGTPTWSIGGGSVSGSVSSSRGIIKFDYNEMTAVYGTASTLAEVTVPITVTGQQSGSAPKTEVLSITWGMRYNASRVTGTLETLSLSVTHTSGTPMTILTGSGKPSTGVTWGAVYGDSTKSVLGHPTYIDCDLGEAYKYEDGALISLNGSIDLGSELPTLAVGDTEITFDNTITDLKVVPNWWKV